MKAEQVSGDMKLELVKRLLAGEPSGALAQETGVREVALKEWESRVLNAGKLALCSDDERRAEVSQRLGKVLKEPRTKGDQGYWDRLQRSRSWLIAARDHDADPDIVFICHWIALNALFGGLTGPVERKPDKPPVRDRFTTLRFIPADILEFARRVSRIDTTGRINLVLKDRVSFANAVIKDKWHLKLYWEQGTSGTVAAALRRDFQDAKAARETGAHAVYLAILVWKIGAIRHHILHGASTYCVSKNRESVQAAVGLLQPLVPCFLDLLYGEAGRATKDAWPPVPKPRAGSQQHFDGLGSA
jgi:broad specificity phosphatase PhoE